MKLLLTADLHIAKAEDVALLRRILFVAQEQGCAALLIGGDLLDSPFPNEQTEGALLAALSDTSLQVFLVAGNHDPLMLTACYQRLPSNVTVFQGTLSSYPLGEGITLHGLSALKNQGGEGIRAPFSLPQEGVHLLMAHGSPDGGQDGFFPISTAALAQSGFSLALIGHIHKSEQRTVGGCRILVPGIPEGRGWDELGERVVWLAETGDGGALALSPIKVAEKTYAEIEVEITDCNEEEILQALEAVEIPADTVARLILTGAPACDPEVPARVYCAKYGREIKDLSDPTRSLALLMKQNTLQGAFVRRAMAEIEQASGEERVLLEEALRMGLRALKEGQQ